MTNAEKNRIIMELASNPDLLKAFLDMVDTLESGKVAESEKGVYLYTMVRHTEDGAAYYHPMVNTKDMYAMYPTDDPKDYGMVAGENLIALQEMAKDYIDLVIRMLHEHPVIIKISTDTYKKLEEKLDDIMVKIFDGITKAMDAIGAIPHMAGKDYRLAMTKADIMQNVLGELHSKVNGVCLNEDMEITAPREYVEDKVCEDEYDEYGDDDDYCEDYDEDDPYGWRP